MTRLLSQSFFRIQQVKLLRNIQVLSPSQGETPEGILIATGSEVDLAVKAQKIG
ncbi:hypothetical protein EfmAA610_13930 [Enterococcus faecium]|nr:hypothetical protein EfmAA610_13930 [Enterococcus faecium]